MNEVLTDYPVVNRQTVAWGDMDALGHLNNVRYYDYAQEARIIYMNQVLPSNYYTVIVSTSCQYMNEVKYPDILQVGVRIKKLGNTSITHEIVFFSESNDRIVATGESVVVLMNKTTGEKQPITNTLKEAIAKLENRQL